jgi:PPP family 3-phenylpropionic acid transporter
MSLIAMKYIFVLAGLLLVAGWILLLFFKNIEKPAPDPGEQKTTYLKLVFFNKKIAGFLLLCILIAIAIQSVWGFQTTYLNSIGAGNQVIGISIMIQALSELPFYPISYFIIRKIGLLRSLSLSIVFTVIRLLLYGTISNPYFAIFIELLQGFSFILTIITAVEFLNHEVPGRWRATGQSLFASTYYGIGAIIGNWWAGFLIDRFDIQKMFLINAGVLMAVFLFSLGFKNVKYEPAQAGS